MGDGKKSYKEEYVANTSGIHERASQVALALKLKFKIDGEQRRKLGRDGREFLVMTAHLASGNKLEDMPTKRYQGQQVANIIAEQNKAHNLPVIFACDFNNAPGGPTHKGFFGTLNDNLGKNPVTSAYASMLQYRDEWRCPQATDQKIKDLTKFQQVRMHLMKQNIWDVQNLLKTTSAPHVKIMEKRTLLFYEHQIILLEN